MVKPLGFGIVGTGKIHRAFSTAAKLVDGVTLRSVFSRKLDTGAAFAEENGVFAVYSDFDAFLADPELDAVYVASPILFHERQTLAALAAGKHVFCEKSITTDEAAFLRMKDAAKARGLVLLEAMRPDFDPALPVLRAALPAIGRITRADFVYKQYSSRYDAFKAGIIENAFDPALRNSALSDIGVYPLHLCLSLFGDPTAVAASSTFLSNGFEGAGELALTYPAFTARVAYSKIGNSTEEYPSFIEGERGRILFDSINAPKKLLLEREGCAPVRLPLDPPTPSNMTCEIAAFAAAVRGELDPAPYLAVTQATMRVMDEAIRQAKIFG